MQMLSFFTPKKKAYIDRGNEVVTVTRLKPTSVISIGGCLKKAEDFEILASSKFWFVAFQSGYAIHFSQFFLLKTARYEFV